MLFNCFRLNVLVFILFFPVVVCGQLWPGNLGLPIVNIDFGAGNGSALPGKLTSYQYAHGCPGTGFYSIEHFLFGCANKTWIVMTGDHTGNYDGNYMLVNAAGSPGNIYLDTIRGLCNNTTYQFSAWATNAMKDNACGGVPELPSLSFTIEDIAGKILSSYTSGDLPLLGYKEWLQYGTFYTTPANTGDLVIRISSAKKDTCGDAFLLDDITLKAAGPSIVVSINGNPDSTVADLCFGYTNPLKLECTYSAGFNSPEMQWQTSRDSGKTWMNITGATTNTYFVPHRNDSVVLYRMGLAEQGNLSNSKCTIYSDRIWTNVHPLPDHSPFKQVQGCLTKDVALKATAGFLKYRWTGPNGFQSNMVEPVLSNLQNINQGLYQVLLTADFGCTAVDSIQLNIFPGTTINTVNKYNVCQGTTVHLSATGVGSYEWSPSTGLSNAFIANPVVTPQDSIQYKILLTNSYGCKDSALVDINVYKKTFVDAGMNKTILTGDTVRLDGVVKGTGVDFYWSSSNIGSLNSSSVVTPSAFPLAQTIYTLHASSTLGCGSATDDVTVSVYKEFLVPKAFTPNGDGKNDLFRIIPVNSYQLVNFKIFDRLGGMVFNATDQFSGWDGRVKGEQQDAGVYVYYLELKSASGKMIVRKGSIVLLR